MLTQRAAEILDLKPSTLNFRIRKLGLVTRLSEIRLRRPFGHR